MRRGHTFKSLLLVGGLAVASLTPQAHAAPIDSKPQLVAVGLATPASNGFTLYAFASPPFSQSRVTVMLWRSDAYAAYSARGTTERNRLEVDLGKRGSVTARFHPRGGRRPLPKPGSCEDLTSTPRGVWKGRIRFRGEGNFSRTTRVRAYPAPAPLTAGRCAVNFTPPPVGVTGAVLTTGSGNRSDRNRVSLQAVKVSEDAAVSLGANVAGVQRGISTDRGVTWSEAPSLFSYDSPASSGTLLGDGITLEGSAAYTRTTSPGSTCSPAGFMTGSLSVDFPGAQSVLVAGPGFLASLRTAEGVKPDNPCPG